MANIRDIKKDVNFMVEHFIQECYIHLTYSPPLHMENVLDIISDAVELKNATIKKVNNPPKFDDAKETKRFFKELLGNFYNGIVELTERLNSLNY